MGGWIGIVGGALLFALLVVNRFWGSDVVLVLVVWSITSSLDAHKVY